MNFKSKKSDYIPALDGLRGIAVLFVFLAHLSNNNLLNLPFLDFSRTGRIGVYLFYILSAYLLDRQIIKFYLSKNNNSNYWKNYVFRRFLRIYPLFLLSLITYFGLSLLGIITPIDTFKTFLAHVILYEGGSVFWSIPIEFSYYLISPFLMFFMYKYLNFKLKKVTFFLLSIAIVSTAYAYYAEVGAHSLLLYLPLFLGGTLIAIVHVKNKTVFFSRKLDYYGLAAIVILLFSIASWYEQLTGNEFILRYRNLVYLYLVLWSVILVGCIYNTKIADLFKSKVLINLGKMCYSLYLFHMPVIYTLLYFFGDYNKAVLILMIVGLSFSIAYLSYKYFEKPFSKIYYPGYLK